jgi:hypothetical protein
MHPLLGIERAPRTAIDRLDRCPKQAIRQRAGQCRHHRDPEKSTGTHIRNLRRHQFRQSRHDADHQPTG